MLTHRPFEVDQAEGLRKMFANLHQHGNVIGFIAAGRDCGATAAIGLIATRLRTTNKHVMIVDEQPSGQLSQNGIPVLRRPKGSGQAITEGQRREYDLVLVDAYPSHESQIHRADLLVLVSKTPDYDADTVSGILKAVSRAPQQIGLLLTGSGSKLQMLGCRRSIEDIAETTFGRKLHWLGAIPTHQSKEDIAIAVDNAAQRLCQLQPQKELADV